MFTNSKNQTNLLFYAVWVKNVKKFRKNIGSNESVAVSYSIQNIEKVVGLSVALRISCSMDFSTSKTYNP